MHEDRKRDIHRLADIYLNDLESIGHDAGWSGESMVAQYTKYLTQVQYSNKAVRDGKMLYETSLLRRAHPDLPIAKAMVEMMNGKPDKYGHCPGRKYTDALLSQRYYLHDHYDSTRQRARPYTNEDRAREVKQPYRSYKRRLVKAYQMADEILQELEGKKGLLFQAA